MIFSFSEDAPFSSPCFPFALRRIKMKSRDPEMRPYLGSMTKRAEGKGTTGEFRSEGKVGHSELSILFEVA